MHFKISLRFFLHRLYRFDQLQQNDVKHIENSIKKQRLDNSLNRQQSTKEESTTVIVRFCLLELIVIFAKLHILPTSQISP